jgi:hypothetical protein
MKSEIGAIPFLEFIGWLKFDRDECIGPERQELMTAILAQTIGQTQGADVDIFDFLALNPWSKVERPMPSDEAIISQIEHKTKTFLTQREKANG